MALVPQIADAVSVPVIAAALSQEMAAGALVDQLAHEAKGVMNRLAVR